MPSGMEAKQTGLEKELIAQYPSLSSKEAAEGASNLADFFEMLIQIQNENQQKK